MRPLGSNARAGLSPGRRAAVDVAGLTLGGALAAVAAVRRGKAAHPKGVVHEARVVVEGAAVAPDAPLLRDPGDRPALIRFSRSLGLPPPLPDLLGASLRIFDAHGRDRHQDFLMVTSVDLPVLHHVFVPALDRRQRVYSSSLPYRAGDGAAFLVGLLPEPAAGDDLFRLAVSPVMGRFRPVATVHVGARLPDAMDAVTFNPWNTGGGIRPVGVLNRLRDYAYPMSQRAWRAVGTPGAPPHAGRAPTEEPRV